MVISLGERCRLIKAVMTVLSVLSCGDLEALGVSPNRNCTELSRRQDLTDAEGWGIIADKPIGC